MTRSFAYLPQCRRLTACVLATALAACVSAQSGRAIGGMGPEAAKAKARADSLRWPYTEADIHFMSTMIHHHAQAIVMSKWASTHDASPALLRLTQRIINAQSDEIAMMSRWLADRNQPVPEPNPAGRVMQMGGVTHTMLMPGMLTEDQMKQLDAARGPEFDRLFLTFMIQHHRGAVQMVQELLAQRGAANDEIVFKFAADVNVDQTTEINRMLEMLLVAPESRPPSP
jgi:uncharacterized protein (DUF305 family)